MKDKPEWTEDEIEELGDTHRRALESATRSFHGDGEAAHLVAKLHMQCKAIEIRRRTQPQPEQSIK